MESTSHCLGNGFLDRPEQGGCQFQISARQPYGMLKLLRVEDPVIGVSFWEFIGPCHINADIGRIAAESRPDLSSALTEGDGRTPNFTQQEMRPAKQTAGNLNGEIRFVGGLTAFPKRNFHRY
jgi:hypothetical protein